MNLNMILLIISLIAHITLLFIILKSVRKTQLEVIFSLTLLSNSICIIGQTLQLIFIDKYNPIYLDYFVYIGTCFLPLCIFFTGLIFENTKIHFKKRYILLFTIPIISLLVLWTNDYHHLFYENYSVDFQINEYGPYAIVHNIYSYILLAIGLLYMLRFSIKNAGFFSKQSLLIVFGISIPVIINILGTFKITPMSIYLTPITFTIAILFCAISIFKFQFLAVVPIALQKIVDQISDSYIVLGEDNEIIDFNKTLLDTFRLKSEDIRSKNLIDFLQKEYNIDIKRLEQGIKDTKNLKGIVSYEQKFEIINKYFMVEISSISSDKASLGTLVLLKDITQHKDDMAQIESNQKVLMERERLASLGQLIGGIAHNLKTPIMSISGAVEGLEDLIKEYDESIDDPLVNSQDHHEIAKDMQSWLPKIRAHIEYMSDIITTVKGQAVALSNTDNSSFTIGELVKRVNILMKHELKNSYTYLNVMMKADENLSLRGDVNSLVQVVNNMISNAIQAYGGKRNQNIEIEVGKEENYVIFSVKDYAGGLPKEVQEKLFKEMVTTKGKNGTGLGLYMSYSNIRARFGGDITVETKEGFGTTFNIILPI